MPTDTTPDPRDMERIPEEQQIPQGRERAGQPDIARRPALPVHPKPMVADVEDEEDDPVGRRDGSLPASDGELNRG